MDNGVPARDALDSAFACRMEIRPPAGWRRPPGCPRKSWLHQIGSTSSIYQEWDLAAGRGHTRRMRLAQRTFVVQALWWWWWRWIQVWYSCVTRWHITFASVQTSRRSTATTTTRTVIGRSADFLDQSTTRERVLGVHSYWPVLSTKGLLYFSPHTCCPCFFWRHIFYVFFSWLFSKSLLGSERLS